MVSRDKVIFIRQLTAIYSQRVNTIEQLIRPSNNQSPIRVKSSALLLVTFHKFLSSVEMYRLIYRYINTLSGIQSTDEGKMVKIFKMFKSDTNNRLLYKL